MDRTDGASLDYVPLAKEPVAMHMESSLEVAEPGMPGESTSTTRRWPGIVRNVVTAALVGAAIIGIVRVFDSPKANASESVSVTAEASGPAPKVGQPVTDFEARTLDGKTVHLSDYKGHPVWITFWASWCPPCRAENADVEAAYLAHQDSGLVILAVNLGENASTVQPYVQRTGMTFPVVLDQATNIAATYRVVGIPTHFFVDANGILAEQRIGGMSRKTMDQKIQALIARGGTAAGGN